MESDTSAEIKHIYVQIYDHTIWRRDYLNTIMEDDGLFLKVLWGFNQTNVGFCLPQEGQHLVGVFFLYIHAL